MAKSSADKLNGNATRPFLKWAGNKFRIVDRVRAQLPEGKRLVEPFAGSGALFLNTDYKRYLLTDSNRDLIELFTLLQQDGDAFIEQCRDYFSGRHNDASRYYELRERFNHIDYGPERAALFIYLNRHGYNGLCRYNSKGGFNVPFGRYKRPYFPEKEMRAFISKARRARFVHQDFRTTMKKAKAGDVVYCDPPYVPLSSSANFTSYSAGGFAMEAQEELAKLAARTAERGIPVLISNHNTPITEQIYAEAERNYFTVQRYISCNGTRRQGAGELLALYSP